MKSCWHPRWRTSLDVRPRSSFLIDASFHRAILERAASAPGRAAGPGPGNWSISTRRCAEPTWSYKVAANGPSRSRWNGGLRRERRRSPSPADIHRKIPRPPRLRVRRPRASVSRHKRPGVAPLSHSGSRDDDMRELDDMGLYSAGAGPLEMSPCRICGRFRGVVLMNRFRTSGPRWWQVHGALPDLRAGRADPQGAVQSLRTSTNPKPERTGGEALSSSSGGHVDRRNGAGSEPRFTTRSGSRPGRRTVRPSNRYPVLRKGRGLPFGAAVWLFADELSMPAAGLSKPPAKYPISVHAQSLAAHFVFGGTTEIVRGLLRERL